jgi:nucleotide exchange factor SIL1
VLALCVVAANSAPHPEFVPTREFQKVLEGQSIPPGLHVKMDLATGEKFAKLIDDEDHTVQNRQSALVVQETDAQMFLKDLKLTPEGVPYEFRHAKKVHLYSSKGNKELQSSDTKETEEIPSNTSEGSKSSSTTKNDRINVSPADFARMQGLVEKLELWSQSPQTTLTEDLDDTLSDLEDIVHDYSIGIKFTESNGFNILLSMMRQGEIPLRKKAALVLGSSVQVSESKCFGFSFEIDSFCL